ncbi:hypothetical protein DFJ58DRAFT_673379 [Suillus subalutaceus]|uniref:uncharacterized protein n=1 Tax=Suillus subalutaceus TaxID=48586 RepID=UPI001B878716|nr:uncharacterized protein DFJ58DRAFT_673379 [Suillus subalutaceus]KAG1818353.1 hypothetical protein DFJ58DRAFT_673379 [Suillus subalutaceus]
MKDNPQTSAHSTASECTSCQNLTLSDWMTVYYFIVSHPTVAQTEIVKHFKSLKSGALIFKQSMLSHKLREHPKMEAQVNDNPSALSSKWPRIVTRPDVEHALILWVRVRHMENRCETVTGPMLREKRKRFEDKFDVTLLAEVTCVTIM